MDQADKDSLRELIVDWVREHWDELMDAATRDSLLDEPLDVLIDRIEELVEPWLESQGVAK
jgi:hypothetical protein